MKRPKLVVFDLDFTLWPYWLKDGTHVINREEQSVSVFKIKPRTYKDVPEILEYLKRKRCTLAVASKVIHGDTAIDWLRYLDLLKYFTYIVAIHTDHKTCHFTTLRAQSGVEFQDMLFFDDLEENVNDIGHIGVTCERVAEGLTFRHVHRGLHKFSQRRARRQ